MDTLADYTLGSESASSLMVFDKDERRIKARKPVGDGFGTELLPGASEQGGGPAGGWCRCHAVSGGRLQRLTAAVSVC